MEKVRKRVKHRGGCLSLC